MNTLLGSGGEIEDIKTKEEEGLVYDTAIVTNLSIDVGVEDLKDLFDEFFQVKDMEVTEK